MPEIKLNLSNRTPHNLVFTVGNKTFNIADYSSKVVNVESNQIVSVSGLRKGVEGDSKTYQISKDSLLECQADGSVLTLFCYPFSD
jgi:hypothetical protein